MEEKLDKMTEEELTKEIEYSEKIILDYTEKIYNEKNGREISRLNNMKEYHKYMISRYKEKLKGENKMNFGQALEELKKGEKLARKGWNGKGMFIYYVAGGDYLVQMEAIYPWADDDCKVKYNPYLAIKNVNNTISTWVPSINDCLAEDWEIVEDCNER